MMKLDAKFHGVIVKNKDSSIVPPDQWPATLAFYEDECVRLGAALEQIAAVRAMRDRLSVWRAQNGDRCKVPDVQDGELQL